jgi:hypothetical protein
MNYSNKTLLFLLSYMFMPLMAISALPPLTELMLEDGAEIKNLLQDLQEQLKENQQSLEKLPENLQSALTTLRGFDSWILNNHYNKTQAKITARKFRDLEYILSIIYIKYKKLNQDIPDAVINALLGKNSQPRQPSSLHRLFMNSVDSIAACITRLDPPEKEIGFIDKFILNALDRAIIAEIYPERQTILKSILDSYKNNELTLDFKSLEIASKYMKGALTDTHQDSIENFVDTHLFRKEKAKLKLLQTDSYVDEEKIEIEEQIIALEKAKASLIKSIEAKEESLKNLTKTLNQTPKKTLKKTLKKTPKQTTDIENLDFLPKEIAELQSKLTAVLLEIQQKEQLLVKIDQYKEKLETKITNYSNQIIEFTTTNLDDLRVFFGYPKPKNQVDIPPL